MVEQAGERVGPGERLEALHHPRVGQGEGGLGGVGLAQHGVAGQEAVRPVAEGDEETDPPALADERHGVQGAPYPAAVSGARRVAPPSSSRTSGSTG